MPKSAKTGPKRIDDRLKLVLFEAWKSGFTTKSDFARDNADIVAMAASLNFITTRITTDLFGKTWSVTPKGLVALEDKFGINTSEDDD